MISSFIPAYSTPKFRRVRWYRVARALLKHDMRDSLRLPIFISASELFLPTTRENGAILTIGHQRWRHYYFLRPSTLENAVEPPARMLVSSR